MKKKLVAFIAAAAMITSAIPVMNAGAATYDGLHDFIYDIKDIITGQKYEWDTTNGVLKNTTAIKADADMKAKQTSGSVWQDKVASNTYSAGSELSKLYSFDYKTTLKMGNILVALEDIASATEAAIDLFGPTDPVVTPSSEQLKDAIDTCYIQGATFTITVSNPNGMVIPDSAKNGSNMEGFKAVSSVDGTEITVADNKLTIPGDDADTVSGSLVYTESSRTVNADGGITIAVTTEGKTTKKALENALKYDLVLEVDGIEATGPASRGSEATYELVGTVTGMTPVYADRVDPIAELSYAAVQEDNAALYDDKNEISASVKITTTPLSGTSGVPSSTSKPTATPTATPQATLTPTYAPEEIIPAPAVLNSTDHYAYIIGYPEGDVRPLNNITREEVVTIFYRLLTDEAREKMFTTTNTASDVEETRWSNNAISTMQNGGYIKGYDDGTFKPGEAITRAEFVTIATRFYEDVVATGGQFVDVENHWAEKYIDKAVFYRLIDGYDDETFRPDQSITRCEVMKIVNAMVNRCVEAENILEEAIAKNWVDNPEGAWYYTEVFEASMTHDFERIDDTIYEKWTALKENPNWVELEKEWSDGSLN